MNMRPEQVRLARQWIARAEEDLLNAEHTLTLREATEAVERARRIRAAIQSVLPEDVSQGAA